MIGLLLALCFAAGVGLLIVALAREPQPIEIGSLSIGADPVRLTEVNPLTRRTDP